METLEKEMTYEERMRTLYEIKNLSNATQKVKALRDLEKRVGLDGGSRLVLWSVNAQEALDKRDYLEATILAEAGAEAILDVRI